MRCVAVVVTVAVGPANTRAVPLGEMAVLLTEPAQPESWTKPSRRAGRRAMAPLAPAAPVAPLAPAAPGSAGRPPGPGHTAGPGGTGAGGAGTPAGPAFPVGPVLLKVSLESCFLHFFALYTAPPCFFTHKVIELLPLARA